jgi:hypothetical protein
MWIIFHKATCPYLDIAQQNAEDAREAAQRRREAAEAGEAARERMAATAAEARAEALVALKSTMVAAHPDRGGDAAHFIAALHAWRAARRI